MGLDSRYVPVVHLRSCKEVWSCCTYSCASSSVHATPAIHLSSSWKLWLQAACSIRPWLLLTPSTRVIEACYRARIRQLPASNLAYIHQEDTAQGECF